MAQARNNELLDLLRDDRFAALLAAFVEAGHTRADFDAMELPVGYDADDIWQALFAIRRGEAIHYRDVSYEHGIEIREWYTPTRSIENMLRKLTIHSGLGSSLEAALGERHGRRFIVQSLIEETAAALSCDGLAIDYETARGVIGTKRAPQTTVERLAANTHALLMAILDKDQVPAITPAYIREIYARLTEGVDTESFTSGVVWGIEWPEDPAGRIVSNYPLTVLQPLPWSRQSCRTPRCRQ